MVRACAGGVSAGNGGQNDNDLARLIDVSAHHPADEAATAMPTPRGPLLVARVDAVASHRHGPDPAPLVRDAQSDHRPAGGAAQHHQLAVVPVGPSSHPRYAAEPTGSAHASDLSLPFGAKALSRSIASAAGSITSPPTQFDQPASASRSGFSPCSHSCTRPSSLAQPAASRRARNAP